MSDGSKWVVVLGSHDRYRSVACWVFDDQATAERFAEYVTREIDPAEVHMALDPVAELLTWRENQLGSDSPFEESGAS